MVSYACAVKPEVLKEKEHSYKIIPLSKENPAGGLLLVKEASAGIPAH